MGSLGVKLWFCVLLVCSTVEENIGEETFFQSLSNSFGNTFQKISSKTSELYNKTSEIINQGIEKPKNFISEAPEYLKETFISETPEYLKDSFINKAPEYLKETFVNKAPEYLKDTFVNKAPEYVKETFINKAPEYLKETFVNKGPQYLKDTFISQTPKYVKETFINKAPEYLKQTIMNQAPEYVKRAYQSIEDTVIMIGEETATFFTNAVLEGVNVFITLAEKKTIPLPDINTSVLAYGNFEATGGKFTKLSKLSSNGTIKLHRSGMFLTIDMPFTLSELMMEYTNYKLSTWGASLEGSVSITVGMTSFSIKLQLEGSVDCNVNLVIVELQTIDGIVVGLPVTDSFQFMSSAVNYVTDFIQENIVHVLVQQVLDELLSAFVNKNIEPICSMVTRLNIF